MIGQNFGLMMGVWKPYTPGKLYNQLLTLDCLTEAKGLGGNRNVAW